MIVSVWLWEWQRTQWVIARWHCAKRSTRSFLSDEREKINFISLCNFILSDWLLFELRTRCLSDVLWSTACAATCSRMPFWPISCDRLWPLTIRPFWSTSCAKQSSKCGTATRTWSAVWPPRLRPVADRLARNQSTIVFRCIKSTKRSKRPSVVRRVVAINKH